VLADDVRVTAVHRRAGLGEGEHELSRQVPEWPSPGPYGDRRDTDADWWRGFD